MKKKYRQITLVVGFMLALLAVTITLSSNWQISWWLFGSGGGVIRESGRQLVSAAGQPVAGEASNGYTLNSGFYLPGVPSRPVKYQVMIPVVLRNTQESLQEEHADIYLQLRKGRLKLPVYGTRERLRGESSTVTQLP